MVDINQAGKQRGKYPPLSPTLTLKVNNCFSIHHTSWITSGPKSNFFCDNIRQEPFWFSSAALG